MGKFSCLDLYCSFSSAWKEDFGVIYDCHARLLSTVGYSTVCQLSGWFWQAALLGQGFFILFLLLELLTWNIQSCLFSAQLIQVSHFREPWPQCWIVSTSCICGFCVVVYFYGVGGNHLWPGSPRRNFVVSSSSRIRARGISSPEFPGCIWGATACRCFYGCSDWLSLQVNAVFGRKISAGILQGIYFVSVVFFYSSMLCL